ncbi:WD40 repeat domain-containing protein [Sorangium sp. So ce131]|uniref:WD40 repeat domain-containing protein n=1 Tax=Sorangium sp. So ce131 TaxID=3133282 RepID=UPI003F62160C
MTPDGRFILASRQGTLSMWVLSTGKYVEFGSPEKTAGYRVYEGAVDFVAVTPDGRLAISAYRDKLTVWEVSTGQVVRIIEVPTATVTDVAVTPDGRFAVSASSDRTPFRGEDHGAPSQRPYRPGCDAEVVLRR